MRQDFRRFIFAILITIGAAIPLHYAVAYTLDDLGQIEGINNNELYDKACKAQRIVDTIAAVQNGYVKDLVRATIQDFTNSVIDYAKQLVLCAMGGVVGKVTGIQGPTCSMKIAGPDVTQIKQQALRRIRDDFYARCLGRQMFSQIGDDITRILQENGPDGGQAYVSDWVQLPAIEDARAINRFNTILVNTPMCSYFRSRVYNYFSVPQEYIDNPPPIDKNGFKVDGGNPFTLQAACSAPEGLTPRALDANFHAAGGFDSLQLLMRPENNFDDFIQMAQEELSKQRTAVIEGATNEAIAGGGFRGLYSTCIRQDSAGHCLQQTVVQPAGGVQSMDLARKQGEIDWITNSQTGNTMLGDIRQRLVSGMLDIGQAALDVEIEFDQGAQELADIGNATPVPGSPEDPNSPENLACVGGNTSCFCVRNDPEFQALRYQVADATRAAIIAHPELLTPDGTTVLPGQNQNFLLAVCETSVGSTLGCRPNAGSDDEVVVDMVYSTISVDVITSDNIIRIPGQAIASCPPGVQ